MASVQVESGGLKGYFAAHRTLESYPQGGYRWWMLALTVMATVVSFYEFGFSALLPYWMKSLHFSEEDFTYFLALAVFLSAISAMFGGPLADRHGRVVVIDACLVVIVALTFCNLLMTGFWSFVIVRGLMNIVAGLMWGALGGLTRDMSPRVNRGAAFGLLTLGAVACQWLWNYVPAKTLLMFGERWQAEILLMGLLAVILTIPVLIGLKDLSPKLRMAVVGEEIGREKIGEDFGEAVESDDRPGEAPSGAMAAFGQLLGRLDSWVMVLGAVAFLTVAITIQTFGPLMFTQAFNFSRPEAAAMTANFWLFNLIMLVPAGYLSDRLAARKPICIVMAAVTLSMLVWWLRNFDPPLSRSALAWVTLLLGGMAASAFIPWAALYSEYLEDLSPSLQATGWSFFQMAYRLWIVVSGLLIPYVTRVYGWEVWMDLMVISVIIFMGSLLMLRGRWRPALSGEPAGQRSPAHAAGGR